MIRFQCHKAFTFEDIGILGASLNQSLLLAKGMAIVVDCFTRLCWESPPPPPPDLLFEIFVVCR